MDISTKRAGDTAQTGAADIYGADILRLVERSKDQLSIGQRRIAKVVLEDPSWTAQANVDEIAGRASVSAPTVIRFARALGCEGLTDFKLRLAGSLAVGMPYLHQKMGSDADSSDIVRGVVGGVTAILAEWQRGMDSSSVEAAAQVLNTAGRIDCYGTGTTSNFLAQVLQSRLFIRSLNVGAFADAHYQLAAAGTLSQADAIVAISFVGRMPTLLEAIRLGKERGAKIIAITRTDTPLAEMADIVLATDVPSDPIVRVGTDACVVQLLLIEMLTISIGLKRGGTILDRLLDVQRALATYGVDSDDPPMRLES
jgi:RpiR family transcriptional regulator, carbohydrate utilization regulator